MQFYCICPSPHDRYFAISGIWQGRIGISFLDSHLIKQEVCFLPSNFTTVHIVYISMSNFVILK